MRQDRKRHILERDRLSVEQFNEISAIRLFDRRDRRVIEFFIVGAVDAVFQLFLRKIRQKQLHHLIGDLPVAHF